ncbi:MAG TPA: transcription antitermination factor NusB [Stellaceae bacterium]|nr:transcription antitermination factor NusB [Stellaceae bacterium]HMD62761.1 transcription antitermination factor NusB [Stellaceae bacterium]
MTSQAPTARNVALDLIGAVLRRKRPLDEAIEDNLAMQQLSGRDRAFARLLVATVLRRLGQIDALIADCLSTPLAPRAASVHDILRLGVAQLLFLRTPPHAAVATSVDLAHSRGFLSHKGLVNAVLRRLSIEGAARIEDQDAPRLNTPDWLWQSWSRSYGEATARAIAVSHLKEAPLDLTVRDDVEAWCDKLQGILLPTGTLRRAAGGSLVMLPGYAEGAWWVQDAAAALPARLFGDLCGRDVVDLCAAPGGKTAQLATAGARVTAVDRSARRLERLVANLDRLAVPIEAVAADALTWRPPRPVDAVLLDAPCSTTGAIRRHPDVPHLKQPDDVARLAVVQENLLRAAVDMLRPGGTLVYCTCSLEAEEGPEPIAALFRAGAPVARRSIDPDEIGVQPEWITAEGDLRTLPCHFHEYDGVDGFFCARLVKEN